MMRERLPGRRPSVNLPVIWRAESGEHHFTLTVGFDPATGCLREVFYADGQRSGSAMQHSIQDVCVLISVSLQFGVPLEVMAGSLGRVPVMGGCEAASPVGAIIDALRAIEAEGGA